MKRFATILLALGLAACEGTNVVAPDTSAPLDAAASASEVAGITLDRAALATYTKPGVNSNKIVTPSFDPSVGGTGSSTTAAAGAPLAAAGSGLVVNQSVTPTQLAQILAGPGVTVSNVSYSGASVARAAFSGGTGIIGFEEGIILSSGNAAFVPGPNTSGGITGTNGTLGDPALNGLAGATTHDAASLEFDFVPNGSQIAFEYVFSSEEYNEYVNSSYNDAFAFFVNGDNCALLPNGDPVTINNVNLGKNANLYRNNSPGSWNTEMDGLTVVLVCHATVNANQVNHLRLVVADGGDSAYDSNVFLKGASLSTTLPGQISLTPVSATRNANQQHSVTVTVRKTDNTPISGAPVALGVTGGPSTGLQFNTVSDVNGQATFTWTSTSGGTDEFIACYLDTTTGPPPKCAPGTVTWISLNAPPVANAGGPYTGDEGSAISFDGSGTTDPDNDVLTYLWSFGDGATSTDANPTHTYADNGTYTVTLTATDPDQESSTASTTATVANVAPSVQLGSMSTVLTQVASSGSGSFTDPGADSWTVVADYGDGSAAETLTVGAGNTFSLSHAYADDGIYTVSVTVTDDDGAATTETTTATILNRAPMADAGSDLTVECTQAALGGTKVTLSGIGVDPDGTVVSYQWSVDGNDVAPGATVEVMVGEGSHTATLTVTDDDGATASASINVTTVDTTAPEVSFALTTTTLWTPNHKLVTVATGIGATDACDSDVGLVIDVTSNEAINGTGDGNTAPDWVVTQNGDGTYSLDLRAERKGNGTDRVYTVTVTATDAAGNVTTKSGTVTVPHDQKAKGKGE